MKKLLSMFSWSRFKAKRQEKKLKKAEKNKTKEEEKKKRAEEKIISTDLEIKEKIKSSLTNYTPDEKYSILSMRIRVMKQEDEMRIRLINKTSFFDRLFPKREGTVTRAREIKFSEEILKDLKVEMEKYVEEQRKEVQKKAEEYRKSLLI